MRYPDAYRDRLEAIDDLTLVASQGRLAPLRSVAHVGAGPLAVQRTRACEMLLSLGDSLSIPKGSFLVIEEHELAVAVARGSAAVVQQHQREQSMHL